MTPRRTAALLLGFGVLFLAGLGCGAGDAVETTSAAKEEALAKVRAADYAREVNLHASDVPYFEATPDDDEEDPQTERRRERQLRRCLGVEESDDPLAEVDSPTYGSESVGGLLQVESSVSVGADAATAAREAKLIGSRRAERCLRRLFLELLEEEETATTEARQADLSRIPFPAPEIEGGFAYRFSASVTVHGDTAAPVAYRLTAEPPPSQTVDIYIDLLGFVTGPAAVSLNATGAPSPVSKNLERNLLRLLHERATEQRP